MIITKSNITRAQINTTPEKCIKIPVLSSKQSFIFICHPFSAFRCHEAVTVTIQWLIHRDVAEVICYLFCITFGQKCVANASLESLSLYKFLGRMHCPLFCTYLDPLVLAWNIWKQLQNSSLYFISMIDEYLSQGFHF